MKHQENWDFELHNCQWQPETTPDYTQPTKIKSNYNIQNATIQDPTPPQITIQEPKSEPEVIDGPAPPSRIPKEIQNKIIIAHCLPTHEEIYIDNLYGEQRTKQTYGNKFTFEAIIIERGDLTMKFWTAAPIPHGSIIYPSRYKNGIKFGEYRWWQIKTSEPKQEGTIYTCLPSALTPDFSQDG